VTPISESLIPRLSAAKETGERYEQRKAVEKSVRLTVLLAMPASMGILLYSEQILDLIFRGQPKAVSTAAPLLSVLGASVLFSCLITTTNAILQSYRRVFLPIVSMAVGALVKGISAYVLIGNANIGELGAPISTLICNVTVVGLNIYFVDRSVPEQTATARLLVRPFFASVLSVALSLAVYLPLIERLGESVAFLSALVFTLVAYFTFAFVFRAVSVDDLSSIPLFDRILNRKFKNKGVKK
jgi:stage V sporulation protein B